MPCKLADDQGFHLHVTPSGYRSWRWKYLFPSKDKLVEKLRVLA